MINVLDNIVASRIAAGEIIDRPSSVIRELLDNSIDSNATCIDVSVKDGGVSYICVSDNGIGMSKDDLSLCLKSHATSKIKNVEDLYHISSMGFRGEALYALSSCSKVIITTNNGKTCYSLSCDNAREQIITKSAREKGTTVESIDLFNELPARKQFLKRSSSEFNQIKKVFNEKALAFENITFTLNSDDKRILTYNATNKFQRVLDVISSSKIISSKEFDVLEDKRDSFSLYSVCSKPSIFRSDKSFIKIIINNRVVDDFSLTQAIVYGYGELLPGGSYPYTTLFINIDPTLVDFNIHPTKREVKIRNKSEVHHAISTLFRKGIKRVIPKLETIIESPKSLFTYDYSKENTNYSNEKISDHLSKFDSKTTSFNVKNVNTNWLDKAKEISKRNEKEIEPIYTSNQSINFTYIGQIFKLYLLVEKDDKLYIVDQHAAHERILYDKLVNKKGIQNLMIPRIFEVDNDVDLFLKDNLKEYENIGIKLERIRTNTYQMLTILDYYKSMEEKVIQFIQTHTCDTTSLLSSFYASVACRKAIKANDDIDPILAIEILTEVFKLEQPACPHGRTFIVELTKEDLAKLVGRT